MVLEQGDVSIDADSHHQSRMPFVDALLADKAKQKISFHMPGHKGGLPAHPHMIELFGANPHESDLVDIYGNIDYLHAPQASLREAQNLAAAAYGADHTFFLVNGSTVGNLSALLSISGPGQKVIMPRASHRSVYGGLVLSGATPVYLVPDYHPEIGFPLAVKPDAVRALLEQHPEVVAVHLTSPNYYGVLSDTAAIRDLAHAHSAALLVDEAHGSHLGFHPDLPASAVHLRADMIIHSTHKTQGALTQASMLHVNDNGLVNRARVAQVLALLQSSSPNSLLLASLDAARMQMATEGHDRLTTLIELAQQARAAIRQIPGLWCYGDDLVGASSIFAYDPTKLIIHVSDTGFTGYDAYDVLRQQHSLDAEFADLKHVICSITIGDTERSLDQLLAALRSLSAQARASDPIDFDIVPPTGLPLQAISPRDAYFARSRAIPVEQSVGHIVAENLIPYPPGIPLLVPGEIIEQHHLDYLRALIGKGSGFVGTEDQTLKTIRIVDA